MVAIYHVARVIQSVDNAFLGHLLVAVVTLEQSERLLAVLYLNHEFTVHHLRHAVAVLVNDVYVILRIRHSHSARLRFHPRIGAHHHGGLRLSDSYIVMPVLAFHSSNTLGLRASPAVVHHLSAERL